ncbi:MAG TPA: gamma-glutamylcyclotransferase family protein [Magnetovibrio sp.]
MSKLRSFFLYGTLMDPEILNRALGQTVDAERLSPALLPSHRRGYIVGRDFPGLRFEPGFETAGLLLHDVTTRERLRLNVYEGPHYRLASVTALHGAPQAESIAAHVYVVKPGLKLGADWDLESWQQHHKPAYMQRWFGAAG